MVIILRKLSTLKWFYRKTKIGCLNSCTACTVYPNAIILKRYPQWYTIHLGMNIVYLNAINGYPQ